MNDMITPNLNTNNEHEQRESWKCLANNSLTFGYGRHDVPLFVYILKAWTERVYRVYIYII